MVIAIVSVVMIVVGVLMHALMSNATAKEFGRAMFWAGLFAFAFAMNGHTLRIG